MPLKKKKTWDFKSSGNDIDAIREVKSCPGTVFCTNISSWLFQPQSVVVR